MRVFVIKEIIMYLGAIVLDSANSNELADFYAKLIGGVKVVQDEEWIILYDENEKRLPFVFQELENYEPPVWPAESGKQQTQIHLDMYTENVEESVEYAIKCGAKLSKIQLEEDWKVMLDPAGHPFCILPTTPPKKE